MHTTKALLYASKLAKRNYLNTGESYTLALLITALMDGGERRPNLDRNVLYAISTLSKSSIDAHLRALGKRHIVRRDGDTVFFDYSLIEPMAMPV